MTCFAVSYKSKNTFLFGTDKGEVVEYNVALKKARTIKLQSSISTIDISRDDQIWAAGTV